MDLISGEWHIPGCGGYYAGQVTPVCFAMSADRYVVAFNDPGAMTLVLTLVDGMGTVVASTTLAGFNAFDFDGLYPSPMMGKVDETHLLEVLDAGSSFDAGGDVFVQDAMRTRRITVADSGFSVDYDVTRNAPYPPRINRDNPTFFVAQPRSLGSIEFGSMMLMTSHAWICAVDSSDGTPLWTRLEDFGGSPWTVADSQLSMSADMTLLTAYWNDSRKRREYHISPSGITTAGPLEDNPIIADKVFIDGATHLDGGVFANPYLTGVTSANGPLYGTDGWVSLVAVADDGRDDVVTPWLWGMTVASTSMLPFVVGFSAGGPLTGVSASYWSPDRGDIQLLEDVTHPSGTTPTAAHFTTQVGIVIGKPVDTTFHGWIFSIVDNGNLVGGELGTDVYFHGG